MQQTAQFLVPTVIVFILLGCGGDGGPVPAPAPSGTTEDNFPLDTSALPQDSSAAAQFPAAAEHSHAELTFTVIDAPNGTFGYDVFSDGRLFLHQTNIPGQPGVEGCKTKADAEKVAAFVIEKIRKGQMPPTVETKDLQALGIIK